MAVLLHQHAGDAPVFQGHHIRHFQRIEIHQIHLRDGGDIPHLGPLSRQGHFQILHPVCDLVFPSFIEIDAIAQKAGNQDSYQGYAQDKVFFHKRTSQSPRIALISHKEK